MIERIAPGWYGAFADELHEMHCLRYRVFKERLDWNVSTTGGFEIDSFDSLKPHYLVLRDSAGRVGGCGRLLPSTGPTMLRDVFSRLLEGRTAPEQPSVWESSRLALDLPPSAPKGGGSIAVATYELLAGMIEFGLSRQLTHIVTVTDLRMERILRRAGWPLVRIGPPLTIGTRRAVAGCLDVSEASLAAVRHSGSLGGPVLWAPVLCTGA
ncbi:conjugal transfer protein TraI [Mesorhizobium loti]|uniref:Acyl-homoserine-lactone synthase n=1 Tax=Mesorhizobium erdmanii TaxID=1777866 RepID=A0A6M7UT63_9HYPH|nr:MULTISPECIES: acyl-homoserine-lactone synthase [Mesorhizobium]OBP72555.1 conjugal transfer protein TraI [Mesorhizobium loti]OBQ62698.1 conjugal transfer protein TraI [Mesorhizobium loti]QKC80194.1 GNAT family N-acetyltransferase [Mesorhizobium erdmanii]